VNQGTDNLKAAVQLTHGCDARLLETVPVSDSENGRVLWQGQVSIYQLVGHRKGAERCYAWMGGPGNRKMYAVLHEGTIDSPAAAVRSRRPAPAG
jgi:hypothetical protein